MTEMLKMAMMGMANRQQIGILVAATLCSWSHVMNIDDWRAGPAEEAAATTRVARDDALSGLRR